MTTLRGHKYVWKMSHVDTQQIAHIAATYNLAMPIAETLISRGLTTHDAITSFLFSSYEKDVAHPSRLKDAEKAVDRIIHAINAKEPILVFGDYDVDGITSSALMMIALMPLGAQVNFYLPHRVRDGCGISTRIVERAARNGYKVIITVDNGITAFEPAARARELGIDMITTDHHKQHETLPDAFAIVNPNQIACSYPFKSLAGVGVTFKVLSLLYERKGLKLPSKAYELLLLGTIADVVPLQGENRFWVRHGLSYVNNVQSLSLQMLKQNGKISKPMIGATDIGFSITPQINALGRLEDPRQGVKFLIGADQNDVDEVGRVLLQLNETRKIIEKSIVEDIEARIQSGAINLAHDAVIIATSNKWPPGVIGLVASRSVKSYGKPTLLFHETSEGILKGSCRSIPEFNMFEALQDSKELLIQFGGHAQAAGLSLKAENLDRLKEKLNARVVSTVSLDDLQPKLIIDAQAQLPDLNQKFMKDLTHLEPFGHTNSHPSFLIRNVMVVQKPKLLKDAHVKCSIFADGVIKPVIFFNRPELYDFFMNHEDMFTIAAQVQENHWGGHTQVELTGLDVSAERIV